MRPLTRALSSLLLAGGIVMVLGGLSAALGSTLVGALVSTALVAALLYAGAMWFGGGSLNLTAPGADLVIVFDRALTITAGPAPGSLVVTQFPEPLRPEIEMRCRLALRGEHTHFECEYAGGRRAFDISPVQSIQGVVIYGVLVSGSGMLAPATSATPLPTVA